MEGRKGGRVVEGRRGGKKEEKERFFRKERGVVRKKWRRGGCGRNEGRLRKEEVEEERLRKE